MGSVPRVAAAVAVGALSMSATAQQQVVRPPIAVYWLSAETTSGLGGMMGAGGAAGLSAMARAMGSGAGDAARSLLLQLGSTRSPAGEPSASHEIPPGMRMGASLPLLTPKAERAAAREVQEADDAPTERPRGRLKLYWGCGEQVRPGQPVVIDLARAAAGQIPPGLFASRARPVAGGPSPGTSRTYGAWPNEASHPPVPGDASLRGDHAVRSNYAPDIRFTVAEAHDFLSPVAIAPVSRLPSGAVEFQWQPVAHSTGYFASIMGARDEDETVFWTSSEVQEWGGTLFDWLPPAEVARLVREKVAMPPSASRCTVPAQVVRETGDAPMLRFVAWGDELALAHPPRPQDPRQPWEQQWALRLRLKSTATVLLAETARDTGAAPGRGRGGRQGPQERAADDAESPAGGEEASRSARDSSAPDPLREGVRVLRGILGR